MRFLRLTVAAGLSAALPVTAEAAECPNSVFCGGWLAVCKRTLPPWGQYRSMPATAQRMSIVGMLPF